MERYRNGPPTTSGPGSLLATALIGLMVYLAFFYEVPYLKEARAACTAKGGVLEKRPNAIQTHILPFAAENYHYVCRKPRG